MSKVPVVVDDDYFPSGFTAEQMMQGDEVDVIGMIKAQAHKTWQGWQPIETAPRDNSRPLLLAYIDEGGELQDVDFNGFWKSDSESWELPQVYYYWSSANCNIEEPTHWAYQPDWFDKEPACQHVPISSEYGTWCELCETKLE